MRAQGEVGSVVPSSTIAVLDTNVILDILSCHDLMQEYEELGEGAVDQEPMVYRRARARESLLLCMHLHGSWSDTLSLHEALDQLMAKAPPGQLATSFETAFTTIFIWFVKDYVLPRWEMLVPTKAGTEKGSAADRAYVELAKAGGLPLVTNEGFTPI